MKLMDCLHLFDSRMFMWIETDVARLAWSECRVASTKIMFSTEFSRTGIGAIVMFPVVEISTEICSLTRSYWVSLRRERQLVQSWRRLVFSTARQHSMSPDRAFWSILVKHQFIRITVRISLNAVSAFENDATLQQSSRKCWWWKRKMQQCVNKWSYIDLDENFSESVSDKWTSSWWFKSFYLPIVKFQKILKVSTLIISCLQTAFRNNTSNFVQLDVEIMNARKNFSTIVNSIWET